MATTLGALAFLWAGAATVYLLTSTGYEGIATGSSSSASGIEAHRVTASLVSANGLWVVVVLGAVTLLSALPAGVALTHPGGQRATTWSVAILLLVFSLVSGFSVGLFYAPSALLMVLSAVATGFVHDGEAPRPREHHGAM